MQNGINILEAAFIKRFEVNININAFIAITDNNFPRRAFNRKLIYKSNFNTIKITFRVRVPVILNMHSTTG